jgi:Flp pilus assembly pilin Flp
MFTILADDTGAASVEYAILISSIAIGIVAVSFILGGYVAAAFDGANDELAAGGIQAQPD